MKKPVETVVIPQTTVVIPEPLAFELLAYHTTLNCVGYSDEPMKKVAQNRFYFLSSFDADFLEHDQKVALRTQEKATKKTAGKKVSKTEIKEVIEERIIINDILKDCVTIVDCYKAILKVLKKTEITEKNFTSSFFDNFTEAPDAKQLRNVRKVFSSCSSYSATTKNKRAVFNATEIFTKEEIPELF